MTLMLCRVPAALSLCQSLQVSYLAHALHKLGVCSNRHSADLHLQRQLEHETACSLEAAGAACSVAGCSYTSSLPQTVLYYA